VTVSVIGGREARETGENHQNDTNGCPIEIIHIQVKHNNML